MRTIDLDAGFGTAVDDVDLREPLRADDLATLLRLYDERHLLVFRDQVIDEAQQLAFVSQFGPLPPDPAYALAYVSNVRAGGILGGGAMLFHSDLAFTPEPVLGLSLYAIDVPANGAPTNFADAAGVLTRLDRHRRRRLEGLHAVNVFDFGRPDDRRMREADLAPGSPVVQRPLVDRHPRTGAPVLTACEMQTDRVAELDADASEALLAELYEALYAPDHVYAHRWRPGDLLVWDNVALQHGRDDFPDNEARTMRRVCLTPYLLRDLVPNLGELLG
jgi:alpha-ketoglutarate-dependent taurine dioxygenase